MQKVDIILPAMGEGITDATITRWLVAEGQMVEEDQPIVEVATDKVDTEVPSPAKGKVSKLHFIVGDVPKVGQILASIETERAGDEPLKLEVTQTEKAAVKQTGLNKSNSQVVSFHIESSTYSMLLSPLVRSIAKKEGISPNELNGIKGTGLNGRLTRDDILSYLSTKNRVLELPQQSNVTQSSTSESVEVVPMDRMRKLIAQHMVLSKQTSPHVTSFIEVDVTNMVEWRNRVKDEFQKREGEKLTLTPLFVDATLKAISKYPLINSSLEGDKIVIKKRINIGIAAALPNGNLIVPVVKNASKLNISGLAQTINDLAARARTNKLNPDEIQGGTFTITNLGMFDTLTGTPIINQPQVAILAIGAIIRRVVVLNSPQGESIGIRSMAMLSLSYDHRVVDGALGGAFLKELRDIIQAFQPPFA